ncbi:hypothetical protein [Paraburkholderia sp. BR14320]|uniref:hypothetical protein n=1 Tax=unclassified Paraburkholderia TaxID=2615204 RepID=UPI0034CDADCE
MSDVAIIDSTSRSEHLEIATLKDLQALASAVTSPPFEQIAAVALEHFDVVVEDILRLDGERRGKEFVAYNPRRDDRERGSFSINTETGRFADFACDDEIKGGDLIALAAYVWDCGMAVAARRLLDELEKRQIEMPSNTDNIPVRRQPVVRQVVRNEVMSPIPEGSPELDVRRFVARGSILEGRYDYVDANNCLCFVQLRLRLADGTKSFRTLRVTSGDDGSLRWTGGMPLGLRPSRAIKAHRSSSSRVKRLHSLCGDCGLWSL